MSGREEIERRKNLKRQVADRERASVLAGLPTPKHTLMQLLDAVDAGLEAERCDHSLRLTTVFLEANKLPADSVIQWLRDHGGHCDCEVVANIEDVLDNLR